MEQTNTELSYVKSIKAVQTIFSKVKKKSAWTAKDKGEAFKASSELRKLITALKERFEEEVAHEHKD